MSESYHEQRQRREDARELAKPGDKVFVESSGGWHGTRYQKGKIARLTKRWIVLENNEKFRKDNGRRLGRGSSFYSHTLIMATPEDIIIVGEAQRERQENLKRRSLIMAIRDNANKLSLWTLENVATTIKMTEKGDTSWLDQK